MLKHPLDLQMIGSRISDGMVSAQGSTCRHVDQHLSAGKEDPFKNPWANVLYEKYIYIYIYIYSHSPRFVFIYILERWKVESWCRREGFSRRKSAKLPLTPPPRAPALLFCQYSNGSEELLAVRVGYIISIRSYGSGHEKRATSVPSSDVIWRSCSRASANLPLGSGTHSPIIFFRHFKRPGKIYNFVFWKTNHLLLL